MKHPMDKFRGILAEKKPRRRKLTPPTEPEKAEYGRTAQLMIDEYWLGGQIQLLEDQLNLWKDRKARLRAEINRQREAVQTEIETPAPARVPAQPTASDSSTFAKAGVIAKRLGVHPKTIFRWAEAGRFHRHLVGARVVLFDEAEIVAWIKTTRR